MTVSVALSPIPVLQFFDNTGRPAVGGSLTTQVGGVNYPAYSDNTGSTALPNPIPLNSRGEVSTAAGATAELFLQQGVSYTLILKDSAGNQLWSVSNVVTPSSGQSLTFPAVSGTANAIILTNANPITVVTGTIQWFIPTAANTAATTINVDNNGAISTLFLTTALVGEEIQTGVPAQIIFNGTNWILYNSAKGPVTDYYVDTGSANSIVVAVNAAQHTGFAGFRIRVKAAATNTANTLALTLTGFLVAQNVVYSDGVTPLVAGAYILGNIYDMIYVPTLNTWICTNPSRVTGSFTITLTGMTAGTTGTVNYAIEPDGKTLEIWVASTITGTSNSAAMTGTGIPAALTCTTDKRVPILVQDSGSVPTTWGSLDTGTSTTWTFGVNAQAAGFTTSGAKGLRGGLFCVLSTD